MKKDADLLSRVLAQEKRGFTASPLKAGPLFTSRNKFIFASSRALFSALQAKGLLKYWRAYLRGDLGGAEVDAGQLSVGWAAGRLRASNTSLL